MDASKQNDAAQGVEGQLNTHARGGAGGPALGGAPARPASGSSARLETDDYKWNRGLVYLVKHHCKSRACPTCGRRRGWETRQVLLEAEKLQLFPEPVMLTLTVDPKRFDGPEHAHETVTSGGYIRRLLRLLGIKRWVWVLEFHKSGWPHWHILCDLSDRGRLQPADLKRCWRLWRDSWHLGGLDVRERRKFDTAEHAVMYVTKYLTKRPRHGFPSWFTAGCGRRLIQGSQAVGRLCFKGGESKSEAADAPRKRREARTLDERHAECGRLTHCILEQTNAETGEVRREYLGQVEVEREFIEQAATSGALPCRVGLRWTYGVGDDGREFRRVVLAGNRLRDQVEWLRSWVAKTLRKYSGECCLTQRHD